MIQNLEKRAAYSLLVAERKACRRCPNLVNPSDCRGGQFDSEHIGPWSRWQGNLDADLMVIGQDWGDLRCFTTQQGMEDSHNPTNAMLIDLLKSIGHDIRKPEDEEGHAGTLFFTNAVLCLKQVGGLQGPVQQDWFDTCARWFLRPLIELINPRSVICLGERAYRALEKEYHLPRRRFRDVVTNLDGFPLTERTRGYAVYHCGKRILNTHRKIDEQRGDWRRLRELLAKR